MCCSSNCKIIIITSLVIDMSGGVCVVHPIIKEGGAVQGVIASVKISETGCGSQQSPLTLQVIQI